MTDITKRKTALRFRTAATVRGRALVVDVHPAGRIITIREAGRRTGYEVSWESVYWLAAKQAVAKRGRP